MPSRSDLEDDDRDARCLASRYNHRMDRRAAMDYVQRAWTEREASKRAHWAAVYRRDGWQAIWAAAHALLAHARAIQPDFPDERHRVDDLAHHHAVRARLDRAAHAFVRR